MNKRSDNISVVNDAFPLCRGDRPVAPTAGARSSWWIIIFASLALLCLKLFQSAAQLCYRRGFSPQHPGYQGAVRERTLQEHGGLKTRPPFGFAKFASFR
jgi:hypothetical protein